MVARALAMRRYVVFISNVRGQFDIKEWLLLWRLGVGRKRLSSLVIAGEREDFVCSRTISVLYCLGRDIVFHPRSWVVSNHRCVYIGIAQAR